MQLVCRRCGTEIPHECERSRVLGESVLPCEQKGSLWVYVTNQSGEGIKGVDVKVGSVTKTTDKAGFAGFDPLDPGTARLELTALSGPPATEYELPAVKTFDAVIAKGQVSMVELQLASWIEIALVDSKGLPLRGFTMTIKLPDGNSKTQEINEDVVRIPKIAAGDCRISFAGLYDAEWTLKSRE